LKQLSCLLFYAVDEQPDNPVWRGIGYTPSTLPPARAPRVPLLTPARETLDCDVCIVGSGAGGGVIAAELAAAGKRVLVLEAALPLQSDDFAQRELEGYRSLYLARALLTTRAGGMAILGGAALGGGTAVNWQTSLRTPDDVRAEWADKSGCRFFAEESFTRSLDAVCVRSHVGTAESAVNDNNDALRRGCVALGYRWSTIPRNAHGCDLSQCGYCVYGCRAGGKQSTTVTYLRDAVATGNAQVIASCTVERINVQSGAVTGVTARLRSPDGNVAQLIVKAPVVVIAAGGIESPAILMRSGIVLPALGRNLFLHPVSALIGVYPEPIRAWLGPPQTIVCEEYAHIDGAYGCRFENVPAHPGMGANAIPWHGAREHRDLMRSFSHSAAILVLSRDHTGGQVWVNRSGRTQVDYSVGPRELHYLRTGLGAVARIHVAAGARQVVGLHSKPLIWRAGDSVDAFAAELLRAPLDRNASPLYSAHQMGSCRMGSNADAAVCDENGKVFGVRGLYIGDASAFPLSSGVNPMVTIMALAHHTAQRMKATL
jgi:choline dehydrogenase-like flavoprotein